MKVYDCLKQSDLDSMFCMALEDEGGTPVEIPLQMNGIIQYINTCYPTDKEMKNCHHVVVTSDDCPKQFNLDLMFCVALEDEGGTPVEIPMQLNGII